MIRHIVMWDLTGGSPDAKQDNIRRLCASFLGLKGCIPEFRALETGQDFSKVDYVVSTTEAVEIGLR